MYNVMVWKKQFTVQFDVCLVGHTTTAQYCRNEHLIHISYQSHVAVPIPIPKLHHCHGILTRKWQLGISV